MRKCPQLALALLVLVLSACGSDDAPPGGGDGGRDGDAGLADSGRTDAGVPEDSGPSCGDGRLGGAEQCDDGNVAPGDGCSESCAVEPGFACTGAPSTCSALCGDGLIVGDEGCDDDDAAAGDGCSDSCTVEPGYSCTGAPSSCATVCGDGLIAGDEPCDDGNAVGADGCSGGCELETGYACTGEPSTCDEVCGDGLVVGAEACDDGAAADGDGCSASCAVETGHACMGVPSTCAPICGDGLVVGTEQCDDAGTTPGDGCSGTCTIEDGFDCSGMPSACVSRCGDGQVVAPEVCDDGGTAAGDGCSATCELEDGFDCAGEPTSCVPRCGDGLLVGSEACDDLGAVAGDGCSATCTVEAGWSCAGSPSVCGTTCGDGIRAGAEECDDGNTAGGDDCRADCTANGGESCDDALAAVHGTTVGGRTTWVVPAGAGTSSDHTFACDPNGTGADLVFRVRKTTPTLAMGGRLLHVGAASSETTTAAFLDVDVTSSACAGTAAVSERCLWYNRDWEAFLDVPAGDYFVHVAKNSPGESPSLTVFAEEIDPMDPEAEGEGCFAPYTSSSAIHSLEGSTHTWTIPDGIESFDMGPTWGEPQSISCDDTTPYGDIHGADAVIEYEKQSASTVLLVQVQNLDPTLTASDLNVEVLAQCDPLAVPRVSRSCRANLDTIELTAGGPAGPVYLWLTTEATGEELAGASVRVTELTLAPGESWVVAEPLPASGVIAPSSTRRFDVPSCFPATGNIHWYRYTSIFDAVSLRTDAGPIAVFDAGGQELGCRTDGSSTPISQLGPAGTALYVAVLVGAGTTTVSVDDFAYAGNRGVPTDLQVVFPSSATASDYGMASAPGRLFMGGTARVFEIPLATGATAIERGTADGLTTTHLGYGLVHSGSALFSVDSTTATNVSRVFRILDGATWGPTAWDLTPGYPSGQGTYAVASDGSAVLYATRDTGAPYSTSFYSLPLGAAAAPMLLGTSASVGYVVGLAADESYLYVAGIGPSGEGVYRLSKASPDVPPMLLASLDTSTLHTAVHVDRLDAATYLYARDAAGDVHAVVAPSGPSPRHAGVISTLGTNSDYAMVYDRALGAIFLFETETSASGRIVRLD